jgi:hypothetical protein
LEDALTAILRLASRQIRPRQGLVNRKVAAGATNEFVHGVWINELEAVAKCVPLATYCLNRHSTAWQLEVQLHDLAQGRCNSQHDCDSGFANIHGVALQHTTLGELILISTSMLNRGWRRASGIVRTGNITFSPLVR